MSTDPLAGACLATERVAAEGRPVAFAYREAPSFGLEPGDGEPGTAESGWRFLAADDDPDRRHAADFFGAWSLGEIVARHPEAEAVLDAPAGSGFVRAEGGLRAVESAPRWGWVSDARVRALGAARAGTPAAFDVLDWRRFDVAALVHERALVHLLPEDRAAARERLVGEGYRVEPLDFRRGIGDAVGSFESLLSWGERFGYVLPSDDRNLDRLRDGLGLPPGAGRVLELVGAERAWREDERWLRGLLQIARDQALVHLLTGRRFFVTIVGEGAGPFARWLDENVGGYGAEGLSVWRAGRVAALLRFLPPLSEGRGT